MLKQLWLDSPLQIKNEPARNRWQQVNQTLQNIRLVLQDENNKLIIFHIYKRPRAGFIVRSFSSAEVLFWP